MDEGENDSDWLPWFSSNKSLRLHRSMPRLAKRVRLLSVDQEVSPVSQSASSSNIVPELQISWCSLFLWFYCFRESKRGTTYPFQDKTVSGVSALFHPIRHHASDPSKVRMIVLLNSSGIPPPLLQAKYNLTPNTPTSPRRKPFINFLYPFPILRT